MSKRSIDQANQRVAAARELEVSCDPRSFTASVQGLLEKWNTASDAAFAASVAAKGRFGRWLSSSEIPAARHYFLLERPDHLWLTFGTRASRVAERGFNPNDRAWLATVRLQGAGTASGTRIVVALAKWSINDQRLIWNGDKYIKLLDGLVAGLNGRYISAPADEHDYHFIRNS